MAQQPMTDEDRIARGNRATQIVNDPLFGESLAKMKQEVIDMWAATPTRDREGRDWLWLHYQVACKFEEAFVSVMNDGKMAAETLRIKRNETAMEKLSNVAHFWKRG